MAKKTGRKDQISAASLHQELRRPWLVPVLAVFYFLITCLMKHGANKGITLLLLSMVGCMAYHAVQALRRYQRHRQRMEEIQKYYESCLNPVLLPSSDSQD